VTPTAPQEPTAEQRREMYRLMALIRACDERIRRGLSGGEFACTYWPATGQEAIAAAMGTVLRADDQLVSTYRGLHDQLAKGAPLGPVVAEILTRASGVNAGKGGSMHISHPPSGLVLSTGIVGSGLPIAVGVGLALQLQGTDRVAVASFGDGATGTGSFHEAVNLAALWRLPVVFLCQDNRYAEMTPAAHGQPVAHVADRAPAYGIPGQVVDGNDPEAVAESVARARSAVIELSRPVLIEAMTHRLVGHYSGDVQAYRPAGELEAAWRADPVERLALRIGDAAAVAGERAEVEAELAAALEAARAVPFADTSRVGEHLYAAVNR